MRRPTGLLLAATARALVAPIGPVARTGALRAWTPINYRSDDGTRDSEFDLSDVDPQPEALVEEPAALVEQPSVPNNKYYRLVAQLSPNEIIRRFAEMAPQRVQDAAKATILGLMGNAAFAMETETTTTSERLANLMFQLQMTGYMFKNAEYRMSLSQSLPATPDALPDVRGTIKVTVGHSEVTVDAAAYMAELRDEVDRLRHAVAQGGPERDLLAYIRSLPEHQMAELTTDITSDVLDSMKQLVYSILRGMTAPDARPGLLLSQSGSTMAQLIMWQLVIGYNLRDLELRDQSRNNMLPAHHDDDGDFHRALASPSSLFTPAEIAAANFFDE